MSQKLSLVKFDIEDEIPIDETSKRISSTYIPDVFVDFLAEKGLSTEINIKESAGVTSDLPTVFIVNIEGMIREVDAKVIESINFANNKVDSELLIKTEVDDSYRDLLTWLKIWDLLKIKNEKYIEDPHFMLVVG